MTTRALITGLLLTLPLPAAAESEEDGRSMLIEFRVAPYKPAIDEQFSTSPGPYEQIFGPDSSLMLQLVWEGHLINDAGSLTLGVTAAYWSADGKSLLDDGITVGEDTTGIQLFPLALQLSYRLDQFAESFPLAPIARIGLDYYLWRILDGNDDVALFAPGKEAQGGTYGWHASLGVHLLLDFFAPDMAMDFERDGGVYNSYLTAEYIYAQIDEFGSASSIRLGDTTFFLGLALEL